VSIGFNDEREEHEMSMWTTRKWRERGIKNVRYLRELGYSYEEITHHMPDEPGEELKAWEVYELANPSKTAEQVTAWKAKHHPHG
jgi:hypothetical protein